jgi:hypothetical protein
MLGVSWHHPPPLPSSQVKFPTVSDIFVHSVRTGSVVDLGSLWPSIIAAVPDLSPSIPSGILRLATAQGSTLEEQPGVSGKFEKIGEGNC